MTSPRPVHPAHTRLPITRRFTRRGTVARIVPVLAAALAMAVGVHPVQASALHVPAASDTLRVTISAPDGGTVAEGATGHFGVSVAGSTATGAVTVRYSVSGTAVAGEDYTALSGEATVAKGDNVARIALDALDDGILDKGETVVLALTGATGPGTVVVDRTEVTATIWDDGTVMVSLTAVPDTIGEGSAWRSTVTMSTPVADRVSVRWWTSDGTAVAGRDYKAADEIVSFDPGETAKPVEVQTLRDANTEPVEVFYVSLGPPPGSLGGAGAGGVNFAGALSAFIECSVRFPQRDPIVFEFDKPVKAGQVIGTVAAETTPGIPYYELKGGDNKFTINSLTAQISAAADLDPDLYELEVTVHDECGAMASVDVNVRVKQPNRSPDADAGPDQAVDEGDRVDLDGTGSSDSDGTIEKWEWTGPLTLTDADTSTPYFPAPTTGATKSYTFTLTVTDDDGAIDSDDVTIKVVPNVPPDADAGPDQAVEGGDRVDLDGTASRDSDGTIEKWEWTGPLALTDGGTSTPYFTAPTSGATKSYTFTLTVTDDDGATDSDDVTIKVTPPNEAPDADAGPDQTVEEGDRVDLDGTGSSDSDGTIEKWEWTGTPALTDDKTSTPYFTAPTTGATKSYTFTLTVTDDDGATDSDDVTITVVPNKPPDANAGPDQTVDEGDQVDLDGTGSSDSDGTIEKWEWTGPLALTDGDTSTPYFTAPTTGATKSYTFTLTVTDDDGATDSDAVTITVEANEPPDAKAGPDQTVDEGDRVDLDGTGSSDSDGTIEKWEWTGPLALTDGDTSTPYFTAPTTGATKSYTFTLTVTDDDGATDSDDVTITVVPNEPPDADAGPDQTVDEGDRVDLDGTDSSDSDGRIVGWKWTGPLALTDGKTSTPYFTAPTTGATKSYTFTLEVKDNDGATATDRVTVTVEPTVCTAPEANAGRDRSVVEGTGVTLDGGGSSTAASYSWTQTAGPSVTLTNADGARASFKAPQVNGNTALTFRLRVTGDCGDTDTDDVTITVTDPPPPPPTNRAPRIESAIPAQPVVTGKSVAVRVSSHFSDPDGDKLTYAVVSSDARVATVSVSVSTVSVKGVAKGRADVTVTARDPGGKTVSQSFRVTVTDPAPGNRAPAFDADAYEREVAENSPAGTAVGAPVTARAPNGNTLSYALASDGDASSFVIGARTGRITVGSGTVLDHEEDDTYAVSVVASDGELADTAAVTIRVTDVPAPGRPAKPSVTGGDGELTATWSAPANAGPAITGYDLRHRLADASGWTEMSLGNVLAHTVTGLSPGKAYLVQVRAVSPEGAGAWSESGEGTTAKASNRAPVFDPDAVERSVAENSPAGTAVGDPVTAEDPDGNTLTYALAGAGAALFEIGASTGRITVAEGASLDHESAETHSVSVVASDGALADTAAVTIRVTDVPVPGRVDKPGVKPGDGEVTASWRPPPPGVGGVTGYDLRYRKATEAGWTDLSALGNVLEQRIGGLPDGHTYLVQVRAVNAEGAGAWSETGRGTIAAFNSGPEFDAEAYEREVAENAAAGTAVGDPVTAEDPDADRVWYTVVGGSGDGVFEIGYDTGQITVGEDAALDYESGDREYTVLVEANEGQYADTATVTIRVADVPAPGRPDAPVVTGATGEAAVAWSPPANEGPAITAYDLRYRTKADAEWTDVATLGAVLTHTITGLAAGTTYLVQVRASSSEGAGAWSESGEGTTAVVNRAPAFGADAYEREVPENSGAGTAVGDPVTAEDQDEDDLTYAFVSGGDEARFEIDAASGQITVGESAALDYEGETAAYAVRVMASDGTLADTAKVTIRVTDVPAPGRPEKPIVTGGAGEVAVSWSAPSNKGPDITAYDLRYRAKADTEWTEVSALGAVLTHTITGLEAGTAYLVQVRASSSEGTGEWSESGEGTTAKVNRAPAFGSDAYEREVPENSAGGTAVGEPITATDEDADDLAYSFASGGDEASFGIDAATGQVTVAGGTPLDYEGETTAYAVQVVASDGTLADTAKVTIRVTDVPAPGRPEKPVVTGRTGEAAVSWSAPSNEGPAITGYDLRYQARGDTEWTDVVTLGAVLKHTISNLEAGTAYLVQVRASSSEGAGEWSESGEGTTARVNRAPAFGADTYEREVAENSVAGTAVGDPVTAADSDDDDLAYSFVVGAAVPFEIDAASGQISVAGGTVLDYEGETTAYAVRVVASDGTLADTAVVTIRVTDVPAPGRPEKPVVAGGTGEVAVSWSAPSNEGPEITGYDLRYRTKADAEWTDVPTLKAVLTHTITGLEAGTTHEVQVRASSSEGAGAWSESGEGTTAVVNRAPTFDEDTYEREVAENSVAGTAVGDPVTASDQDEDDLTYAFVSGGDEAQFEIDAATGQVTVAEGTALDYEGETAAYAVQVVASDGTLADTAAVAIRVTDVPAPGRPDAPVVTGGTGEASVAWSTPSNEGPEITAYDIRYRTKADAEWRYVPTLGAVLTHTITGLEAGTTYEVQVRASSSEGAGAWSESGEGTTAVVNRAPTFDEDTYEREVAENSAAGTAVGDPVTAEDEDEDDLTYAFVSGADEALFGIEAATGQVTLAGDAALNYESGDTEFTVRVSASDGELADTATVTIRVTNADDPGTIALSPGVARVGVETTATLMDEDGVRKASRKRRWQRSGNGNSWNDIGTGGTYTPVAADAGRWLRAVFKYADRHGPDKRAASAAVKVLAANAAPSFGAEYEREVAENSPGGTKVGDPVAATDPDNNSLSYSLAAAGDEVPFGIDAATGQIAVAEGAALDYESGDTEYAVRVVASDGDLADTASVTIRVTNADDPGTIKLSAAVARVGVRIEATLMDQDRSVERSKMRTWQRSSDGETWTMIVQGAEMRFYTPTEADAGKYLRAVFTYTDGHGPGKRAESPEIRVTGANRAPAFGAETYEREVAENSPPGTTVGAAVTATDPNDDELAYAFVEAAADPPFEIDPATGRIRVAGGAALDYESGDTLYTASVEASDGELADTASVTIRVTNADDPGTIALSAAVARVGVRIEATLTDQDRSVGRGKMRSWHRSEDGTAWTMIVQGAEMRFYTPVEADTGKYLRAVFTYTDGHGPGKRAESAPVAVVGAATPVVSFGADEYTGAPGGSVDIQVLLSPAASAALAVEVAAGDSTHTVTFQPGAGAGSLAVSTAGLSAADTLEVRFGALPDGVAVGVPATTRIIVAAVAGDRAARSVVDDGSPTEIEVEYAQAEYSAVAGGPGTEITLRVTPTADRRLAVPLTAAHVSPVEPMLPDSVVFEPGDSLAAFTLDVPVGTEPGLLALGFGALPEAVSAGAASSTTVDIADRDASALRDEALDVGLAVLGRAVAEGARQAIGARMDAVMRPDRGGSGTAASGSAAGWAGRAAGTLASVVGVPLNTSSSVDMARRSGSSDLPTGREAAERLLPSVSFATDLGSRASHVLPRFGLWAEGSTQSFRGEPAGVDYDGGLRALTVGADARIGSSALLGVSLMRSDGDLDYVNRSTGGSLGHAMNSVHPYLFLRPSQGIGLWAMAGYGSGDVGDDDRHGDTGASLRMLSGGVNVPLARTGAFGLALTGDAFTVGMKTREGRREGSASRARALLEASWTQGRLKLATRAGARYDAGDADTGGGAETGATIGYAGHGIDLDLRGRLALGSDRHREWGAALRLAFDPGTRGEGFRLAISPVHGHDQSGIHGLMEGRKLGAMAPPGPPSRQWRLDAEAGYAIKDTRTGGALDSYTRLTAGALSRSLSVGTRYQVSQTLRLGAEGSHNQLPGQPHNLGLRLALDFTF